ncbi:MAG: hypothetical protein ACREPF_07725, partial [Rhodanobacteraceae bacterium]
MRMRCLSVTGVRRGYGKARRGASRRVAPGSGGVARAAMALDQWLLPALAGTLAGFAGGALGGGAVTALAGASVNGADANIPEPLKA